MPEAAAEILEFPADNADEAILAVARALAIRHARADHAAAEARKQRRKAKTLRAAQD